MVQKMKEKNMRTKITQTDGNKPSLKENKQKGGSAVNTHIDYSFRRIPDPSYIPTAPPTNKKKAEK